MDIHVLICDDNLAVHESLIPYLAEENARIISAYDGERALELLRANSVDLVVLDVMLPGLNGLDVLRELRRINSNLPVIMLSAKSEDIDRIVGLELGADDYVSKPFNPREVAIRIRKLLKRQNNVAETRKLYLGELMIDIDSYEVSVAGKSLALTPKEMELLAYMAHHAGKVLSRELILTAVWDSEYGADIRSVDTQIKRLRKKLPDEDIGFSIKTIYGVGYKLELTKNHEK